MASIVPMFSAAVDQLLQREQKENPELLLVLEIATRAREVEARELPQEVYTWGEVVSIPANQQQTV